jgi:xylose dehydrogenase (NAD/NADP)
MTAKLNWGLLSTARINHAILDGMQPSERGAVLAVASRDAARALAYANERGIPRAYGSYAELLADPDIQIIYNSLPNHLHAEWTIKALRAGKHVLCEKPFALSLEDVDAVFAAAQAAGKVVAEAFMYRHHPKVLKLKALLDEGAIGQPRLMRSALSFVLDRPGDVRWDPAMGGGALWDVGCYPVSLARFLFGAPQRALGWQKLAPSGVDETFVGTLLFPGDCIAQIDGSFRLAFRSFAEVVGDAGTLTLTKPFQADAPDARLVLRRASVGKPDEEQTIELANPGRYWLEIEDLHDAILTGAPPRITSAETRGVVETILALYQSARV